ncbi:MAG: N-6 DNA methylase [Roseiflexus sp.]|nr:N-6 DNA methylase [Roseiflexus sp.]
MPPDATRQSRAVLARLFAACDALADGFDSLPNGERRSAAALTLARLMFLSFLHVRGWLDVHDVVRSLEREDCPGDAILKRIPPGIVAVRSLPCLHNAALRQALTLLQDAAWRLDDNAPNCLTPAMMGVVVERYVERKRSGIYYTGDDVTAYITSRTIIPRLIDALSPEAIRLISDLLRRDPLRYIPAALQHGMNQELPVAVAAGISDVAQRHTWDAAAPASHALPGETWREVIARRHRVQEVRAALRAGIVNPADLVTYNLDLTRLMRDLCAVWPQSRLNDLDMALMRLTVLDPTCGSGAFLCTAFDLLADLASIIAQRRALEGDGAVDLAGRLRAIIEHNLCGVDVMPEAVEICRMRLWLRLAARVAHPDHLRDLRFNVHAGDALTGSLDQASNISQDDGAEQRRPLRWRALFPDIMAAGGFDVVIGNPPYVVRSGLKDDPLLRGYQTATTGNLYALVIERALNLLRPGGWLGVIVPIASVATDGMAPLQRLYAPLRQWHSHYAVRPGKLFPDVDMNLTITLLHKAPAAGERYVSGYRRFRSGERAHMFDTLSYTRLPASDAINGALPKLGSTLEVRLLLRMLAHGRRLRDYVTRDGAVIYYHSGGRYWRKALPEKLSSHYKPLRVEPTVAPIVLALLNSQLFYWYWIAFSNCMDVVAREVLEFPVFRLENVDPAPFANAVDRLIALYHEGATTRARRGARIKISETNIDAARAREVIDGIDRLLAQHYGFDAEELDFVLSYDLKYRLGTRRTPYC